MSNKTAEIYNYIAKLYQTSLKSTAEEIEKKRKFLASVHKISNILFYASTTFVVLGLIGFFITNFFISDEAAQTILTMLCIFILVINVPISTICGVLKVGLIIYYTKLVKEKLLCKLYQALDKNLKYIPGGFKLPIKYYVFEWIVKMFNKNINEISMLEAQISNLSMLLPRYDHIRIDDVILGNYEGRDIKIIEFSLIERQVYHTSENKIKIKFIETFHGVLFQTTMEKQINTNVFIKLKGSNLKCPRGLEKVTLESNEFEKIFETYSNDQVESRYFLNTTTIQNLIDLNNAGQKTSSYVNGNKINLIIHAEEDMFEPDIYKPLDNPNNYFEIIFQAKVILDMITKLKLESKTGL